MKSHTGQVIWNDYEQTKKDQTSTEENHKKAECQEETQKKEYVYM